MPSQSVFPLCFRPCIRPPDDGIVVCGKAVADAERLTTAEYLSGAETNRRRELTWGIVREPPAPTWNHQTLVGRIFTKLNAHATRLGLGRVGVSPLDVILDPDRHLVLQPDLLFVSAARCGIIKDQIWGAPDLVIEIVSPDSRRYDREQKREWYARYGVRELWLVDPRERSVTVCDLIDAPDDPVLFSSARILRSRVLPRLRLRVSSVFG